MIRRTLLLVGALGVIAAASLDAQTRPVKERLVGAWKLVKWDAFDAESGARRDGNYDVGQVIYDAAGQMSAHLMNSTMSTLKAPATDADRATAYRRYLGYYGRFTIDEAKGIVIHHVTGASLPTFVGSQQVRYYTLSADGNSLTLSVKNGERTTSTLYWERIRTPQ
jgi:hypothetical protein